MSRVFQLVSIAPYLLLIRQPSPGIEESELSNAPRELKFRNAQLQNQCYGRQSQDSQSSSPTISDDANAAADGEHAKDGRNRASDFANLPSIVSVCVPCDYYKAQKTVRARNTHYSDRMCERT